MVLETTGLTYKGGHSEHPVNKIFLEESRTFLRFSSNNPHWDIREGKLYRPSRLIHGRTFIFRFADRTGIF